MKWDPRALLKMKDWRVRVGVMAVLLALIVGAFYQIGVGLWASRHYDRANQALEVCDFKKAGAHFDSYLSVRSGDTTVRILAAQTARRQGDFDAAAKHLRLAEKHGAAPEAVAAERRLLNIQAGDLDDAGALVKLCTDNPASPEAALALEALIEGSLFRIQLPLAQHTIDLWLTYRTGKLERARGLLWRASLREFSDDQASAADDCRQAIELAPHFVQAHLRLAEILLRDDPRRAGPELDWLRQHAPDHLGVRFLTARQRRSLGQPEEAARLLDELLALAPEHTAGLLERGRVALDLHQPQDAERWLLRAYELAAGNREVNVALSDCLRQAGRPDEAKVYQQKALDIEARQQKMLDELNKKGKG